MTLKRRLAKVEESLTPTQLVLRWLDEAHAFGDMEGYARSVLDAEEGPLDRLVREAAGGAKTATRGKRPEAVHAAVRTALRETVFRFHLVSRINVTALSLLEREALIQVALSAHLALATCETAERRDDAHKGRMAMLRDLAAFRVHELDGVAEARRTVEARFLDGHSALFPAVAEAWEEQVKRTTEGADLATSLAELDGSPQSEPDAPWNAMTPVVDLVADLVEPAKVTALDQLGETERAVGIAAGWLRTRLSSTLRTGREPAP